MKAEALLEKLKSLLVLIDDDADVVVGTRARFNITRVLMVSEDGKHQIIFAIDDNSSPQSLDYGVENVGC